MRNKTSANLPFRAMFVKGDGIEEGDRDFRHHGVLIFCKPTVAVIAGYGSVQVEPDHPVTVTKPKIVSGGMGERVGVATV